MPAYPAEVVIGGRVAETTRIETVYHGGYFIKVTSAMKDWATPAIAMPACVVPVSTAATGPWRVASTGRSWNQMTSGAGACGGSVASPCYPARPTMGRLSPCVPGLAAEGGGVGADHRVDVRTSGTCLLAMSPGIAGPPGHRHHGAAAMAMDSHCPGCGGEVQVPPGVRGTQMPRAPEKGAISTTRSVRREQYRQSTTLP